MAIELESMCVNGILIYNGIIVIVRLLSVIKLQILK